MRTKPILINVVSGKGGTGKSLLVAMLGRLLAQENASVLLVDLDIFIRGLTHFFYLYKKERRRITEGCTIADFFRLSRHPPIIQKLARERFFEVDLMPAVAEIEEELDYTADFRRDDSPLIKNFFNQLRTEKYDIILIDNRAGIDQMILACCELSDISVSVSEADPVSRTTNDNILRHLKTASSKKVYTLMNKVRYIRTLEDYRRTMEQIRSDYDIIGQIPFDVDLFEAFGKPEFWNEANTTRYAFGVAEAWNKFANREEIPILVDLKRFPEHRIWPVSYKSSMFLNRFERLSLATGLLFMVAYFIIDKVFARGFEMIDILLIYAIGLIILPVLRRLMFQDRFPSKGEKK